MIQFNLLPDVKVEYIKTQKLKRLVVAISIVSSAVSVVILLIVLGISATQKAHLSNLDEDINRLTTELESTPELKSILSVQSQLGSLPQLYDGRPAIDRLPTYLDQITPADLGIGRLTLDLSLSSIEIEGKAASLELVNSFVDSLKFTTYKAVVEENEMKGKAFKDVVLVDFGRDVEEAEFIVKFTFDPIIFDITKDVDLIVPSIVTTRAEVPSADLFNGEVQPTEEEE